MIALPAHADVVSNTNDSGSGSFAQAITDGGAITFSGLANGTTFDSTLPSITNSVTIGPPLPSLTQFTVTGGITTSSANGSLVINAQQPSEALTINSNFTADTDSTISLKFGVGVVGDVTAINGGSITSMYRVYFHGNVTADGVSSVTGNASEININTTSYVGNVISGSLQAGTGDITAINGGHINVNNLSSIYGNVISDGVNSITGESSQIDMENGTKIGNLLGDGSLQDGTGDISATNGGYISVGHYNENHIYGNVLADGVSSNGVHSEIDFTQSSYIGNLISGNLQDGTGDIVADHGGIIDANYAMIYGNATASNNSKITIENNSQIGNLISGATQTGTGDITANDTSEIELIGEPAEVQIYGNALFNDSSVLRNSFGNVLNNGTGTTTFGANATFEPDLLSDPLTVHDLSLSNSHLQPWFSGAIPVLQTGEANAIPVLNYDDVDGTFNPAVVSPFNFGITSDSYSSGVVKVYLKDNTLHLNNLPGSENAESEGKYFNNWFNSQQTDPNSLDLSTPAAQYLQDLISQTTIDGNLNMLDADMPDNLSAHNMQAYWNQKSFVDSIHANLNNGSNFAEGCNMASEANRLDAKNDTLPHDGVWAVYNGNHQSTDPDSGVGSHGWSSSTNGFTLGYTGGNEGFSWGVAAGHQKSDLSFAGLDANGNQEGWNLGLYGSLKRKSTYLTGILGYGNYDNDTYSSAGTGSFKNKVTSASLEIGKNLCTDKKGGFTPFASVLWTKVKQDGAALDNGQEAYTTLADGSNNVFTTELGLRYNHRMFDKDDSLKGGWQAGLSWMHQGGDTGLPANVGVNIVPGSFAVKSTPLAGNSAVVRLGAYGRIHGNLIGFAGYQGTFASGQDINAVNAGVGYRF